MAWTPEQLKAHRAKLRSAGICTRCHKRKTKTGRATCDPCHIECRERRRGYRQTKGRCECGRAVRGYRYRCPRCNENMRASIQRMRERRLRENRCAACGRDQPEQGWRLCRVCQDGSNRSKALRRALTSWRS